ncbi:hypothetical protein BJX96DRAFT_186657 [Aspergillus floccosus]
MLGNRLPKLAVLINADNAQPSVVNLLLAEVARYGIAYVKRAYRDWTRPNLQGWKDKLLKQSIYPIQQFAFCLVLSDSIFTRLAARIRESGAIPFVVACDKFIYTKNLVHINELVPHAQSVILRTTVEAASDDDGWARLSTVGQLLTKNCPAFDSRTYGYYKPSDLISASSLFETTRHSLPNGSTDILVRDKRRKPKSVAT